MKLPRILRRRNGGAKDGFTFIEIITTVAVTALLSALFIGYSAGGRERLTLYREHARLLANIYRAKALAIETYAEPNVPCAFGVNLDVTASRYRLFRDEAPLCTTPSRAYVYDSTGDQVLSGEDYPLPAGYTLSLTPSNIRNITFVPPDPNVYISNTSGGVTSTNATIVVTSPNGSTLSIQVNDFGQITTI
jgi:prepilin-type N-terminal cleavage/methylation domain-containing protein